MIFTPGNEFPPVVAGIDHDIKFEQRVKSLIDMTKIKICGIKTLSDAQAAINAGADYLGFNFFPKSARFIETNKFKEIGKVIRDHHPTISLIGVFVNSKPEEIRSLLETGLLDMVQLHGDESPEFCAAFDNKAFKAFRGIPKDGVIPYIRKESPALLLDAMIGGSYGGTGITADWTAAAKLAKTYPIFLAGGLNPENVREAVRQVHPWGVDVASGVESSPGKKDIDKMKAFIQAVRSMEAENAQL
jgi:phosphoribosylanthranilate isomerase